jgi:hydrogenase nickel incorporation protein HypB
MVEERDIGPIIEMNEEVLKDNEELAQRNHRLLHQYNLKCIEIVGSIGAGKTKILERLAEYYANKKRMFVICGDITTTIDADRIAQHGAKTYQINTGKQCALTSYDIQTVLKEKIPDLSQIDILFIENVGNLICPSDFVLGADQRIVIMSVTEGDHVVIKHPLLIKMSQAIVINKIDLVEILGTDLQRMIDDAKAINPDIKVIPMSAKTGKNFNELIEFIENRH